MARQLEQRLALVASEISRALKPCARRAVTIDDVTAE